MFERNVAKGKPGEALAKEDYMSERALEVFAPKYTSSFSEAQRTIAFSKSMIARQQLADAKVTFCAALTEWLERQVSIPDFAALTLGLKLAPVLEGTKVRLVVTGVLNTPERGRVTFYNEDRERLTWTTFTLSLPLFRKKVTRFTMQQTSVANYVHERMSPQGAGNRVILHHAFGKAFKSFVAAYNTSYQRQFSQGAKP